MKDICQAVYEKLCSDLNISRYVCGRIYPIVLPEDAPLPAIVYTPVLANYDSALQGDTGFVRQTMQLVCHDTTYKKHGNYPVKSSVYFKIIAEICAG